MSNSVYFLTKSLSKHQVFSFKPFFVTGFMFLHFHTAVKQTHCNVLRLKNCGHNDGKIHLEETILLS